MAEKNKKTITGQVLNSIKINKLKCINGLNEIIFKPHALTAILGPNGSGKSTILHAIASIYMPEEGFPGVELIFFTLLLTEPEIMTDESPVECLYL
ncbi:AAA family ATPase [Escherichia coli]